MKTFLIVLLSTISLLAYPRIGNYFLDATITANDIDSLSRCDFLVLDHEVARYAPEVIDSIRSKNPDIKIIAYIVSQEMSTTADTDWPGSLRSSMFPNIQDEWWLKNSDGEFVTFWPGTRMLNIGAGQPDMSAITWNRYLAGVITDSILSNPQWDGIYLDNCWHSVHWNDEKIDVNRDGIPDEPWLADSLWQSGMNLLLDIIRNDNPDKIAVGNGGYRFGKWLNGVLIEDFPTWGGWWRLFDIYRDMDSSAVAQQYMLINGTTENSGEIDLQHMRFGLSSTLMADGYFSYDFGADDHSQNWWFDEYSVDLGEPLEPLQIQGEKTVTSIDFENGIGLWTKGSWELTTEVQLVAYWRSKALSAVVSGNEQWNELLRSPELTLAEGSSVKLSLRLKVDSSQSGSNLFAILRKGDDYSSDISLGNVPLGRIMDSTITFYSDSTITGTGYSLMIGMEKGGAVQIDNIQLNSNEDMILTRKFEKGMVISNPSPSTKTVSTSGYATFEGVQDAQHNSAKAVSSVTLSSQDGIILIPANTSVHETTKEAVNFKVVQQNHSLRISSALISQAEVTIADLRGRELIKKQFRSLQNEAVDLSSLAAGTYSLQIKQGAQRFSQKLRIK